MCDYINNLLPLFQILFFIKKC